MKNKLASFLFLAAAMIAGGQAGFAAAPSYTDTVSGVSKDCAAWFWWGSDVQVGDGYTQYAGEGMLKRCTKKQGYFTCTSRGKLTGACWWWKWIAPDNEWTDSGGGCTGDDNKSYIPKGKEDDYIWSDNGPFRKCWHLKCKTKETTTDGKKKKQYFYRTGNMNSGKMTDRNCTQCELPYVEVVTSDPTEVSYIKYNRIVGEECPAGTEEDPTCTGFHGGEINSDSGIAAKRTDCLTLNCKCKDSKTATKAKEGDDYYAKCAG